MVLIYWYIFFYKFTVLIFYRFVSSFSNRSSPALKRSSLYSRRPTSEQHNVSAVKPAGHHVPQHSPSSLSLTTPPTNHHHVPEITSPSPIQSSNQHRCEQATSPSPIHPTQLATRPPAMLQRSSTVIQSPQKSVTMPSSYAARNRWLRSLVESPHYSAPDQSTPQQVQESPHYSTSAQSTPHQVQVYQVASEANSEPKTAMEELRMNKKSFR